MLSEARYKAKYGSGFKVLSSEQVLQGLPIALALVKARNTFENILSEIRKIKYSLNQAKEINKEV